MKVETFLTKTRPKSRVQIWADRAEDMSINDLEEAIKETREDMTPLRRFIVDYTGFLAPKKLTIYQSTYKSKLQSFREGYDTLRTDYC